MCDRSGNGPSAPPIPPAHALKLAIVMPPTTARLLATGAAIGLGISVAGCGSSQATATVTAGRVEPIDLLAAACAPGWRAPSGGRYRFEIDDRTSRKVSATLEQALSGVVLARVVAGARSERPLAVRLVAGDAYRWGCTASGSPTRYSAAIQVPSSASTAAASSPAPPATVDLIRPLSQYTAFVEARLATLREQLVTLRADLATGSLPAARSAWLVAHLTWLDIGQDDGAYGAFGALGGRIDGTAAGKIGGTASPAFTGFHRVELELWRGDLPAAQSDVATLSRLVDRLTPGVVAADLPTTTVGLDNWVLRCHEILEDALRDTLSGEDDYGSNTALESLGADITATREMLRVLGPFIRPRQPRLVATATTELREVDAAIASAHGRRLAIGALPHRLRLRLDAATGAALETLAPVSELMQVGNS